RQDTRSVFYLYLFENAVNIALALALYPSLHVRGLAYAYAAAYTLSALVAWRVVTVRSLDESNPSSTV
ncbi:MAG: hypothetical protein QOF21_2903, partial [Actinomycetota bacterium]